MSEHVTTPFIPPMAPLPGTPQPPARGPPTLPPNTGEIPAWAATAQNATAYPAWPHTPYTAPWMTPGPVPTQYVPGNYQPTGPPVIPPTPHNRSPYILPNGLSSDYTGYPDSPAAHGFRAAPTTPAPNTAPVIPPAPAAAMPPPVHPPMPPYSTPYHMNQPPLPGGYYGGPSSAPVYGGWGGPPGGYPPFGAPVSAGPYHGAGYGTPWPPPNMGFPGGGGGGMTGGGMPGGWPGPVTGPPAPHMNLPPHPQAYGPPHMANHMALPTAHEGDRVNKFAAGPHYGPVLDPFLLRYVRAKLQLNPLIQPVPETGPDADRPHLKWNMLFPASHCQRSTDASHVSWSAGRNEPATWPRVSKINILSRHFSWMFVVHASNPDEGVTCGDVIEKISAEMYKLTPGADYTNLPEALKRAVGQSYQLNRSRAHGVPGGRLGEGMRRLDFLGKDGVFGGIVDEQEYVRGVVGAVLPATFVLRCVRQYALTPDEIREAEEQQRRIDEEAAAAIAARRAGSGGARSRASSRAASPNGIR